MLKDDKYNMSKEAPLYSILYCRYCRYQGQKPTQKRDCSFSTVVNLRRAAAPRLHLTCPDVTATLHVLRATKIFAIPFSSYY